MSDLGPDSLRELIVQVTYEPNVLGDDPKRIEGLAHADAWEDDIKDRQHEEQKKWEWQDKYRAAQARIETLEQQLETIRGLAGENFDSLTIERKLNDALAAGESET